MPVGSHAIKTSRNVMENPIEVRKCDAFPAPWLIHTRQPHDPGTYTWATTTHLAQLESMKKPSGDERL